MYLDYCMYIGVIDSRTVIMAVFMDDLRLASTCDNVTAHVNFLFTNMGPASEFLNIRKTQGVGVTEVDQEPFVQSMLAKYPKAHVTMLMFHL